MLFNLLAVSVALEIEKQVEHAPLEARPEARLPAELPFAVHELERNVFVRRTCGESEDHKLLGVGRLADVLWGAAPIDQVRIEDRKLVALHRLRGRVIVVVMRLVVFVPLVARAHAVEVPRLSRPIFVSPPEGLFPELDLIREAEFLLQVLQTALRLRGQSGRAILLQCARLRRRRRFGSSGRRLVLRAGFVWVLGPPLCQSGLLLLDHLEPLLQHRVVELANLSAGFEHLQLLEHTLPKLHVKGAVVSIEFALDVGPGFLELG
mmetsp:Transcript_43688/g.98775  ORF Transcript_43688/g.98775 Transcript_43688/m.98775 type:complete len:264 (+) Transcript_43688:483-1274(+)